LTFERLGVGRPRPTQWDWTLRGPPLQAVGEYYNNVDKFKNNRK
jgi:hypothetical protein